MAEDSPATPLVQAFLQAVPGSQPGAGHRGDLETALQQLYDRASAQAPDIALRAVDFATFVGATRTADDVTADALARLCAADLYLACACAHGGAAALERFERDVLTVVTEVVNSLRGTSDLAMEIAQRMRQQLLVGTREAEPSIRQYRGRGPLRAWVRVVAVREALMLMRRRKHERPLDEALLDAMPDVAADPQTQYMRETYQSEFRVAFADAVEALSAKERNLLRYHLIDALSIDQIGALYRVHKTTAYRWLVKSKESLLQRTHERLKQRLGVNSAELDSIVDLVRSRLDLSLERLLVDRDRS